MAANEETPRWEDVPFTFDELMARQHVLTNGEDLRPGDVLISYYGIAYLVQKIFPDSTFQVLTSDGEAIQDICLPGPNYLRAWPGSDETPSRYSVEDGFCPKCKVKLEWTHMAEKCPSCWKVYIGA